MKPCSSITRIVPNASIKVSFCQLGDAWSVDLMDVKDTDNYMRVGDLRKNRMVRQN